MRFVLATGCLSCGIVSMLELWYKPYFGGTGYLIVVGSIHIITAILAVIGAKTIVKPVIIAHTVMSAVSCAVLYPASTGIQIFELSADARRCAKDVELCQNHLSLVSVEILLLFFTTSIFVLNLFAAGVSYEFGRSKRVDWSTRESFKWTKGQKKPGRKASDRQAEADNIYDSINFATFTPINSARCDNNCHSYALLIVWSSR